MRARSLAELIAQLGNLGESELFRQQTGFRTLSWGYRKVGTLAHRMAALLQSRGIEAGDRVMIHAPNGPWWAIVLFGSILSGVVPVPIDLRFRPAFLREVRRQTDSRLLFVSGRRIDSSIGMPVIRFEDLEEMLEQVDPDSFRPRRLAGDDLAEIFYTSGTTSDPKGVMLTHRNLLSELDALQPVVPPEPEFRFLSVLPLSHILEQMVGLFMPVTRGGTIVYVETVRPSAILQALRDEHPNFVVAVPRLLELFRTRVTKEVQSNPALSGAFRTALVLARALPFEARRALFSPVRARLGGSLKYLICGGASLDPGLERFWELMGFVVLQGYGLTETASAVTSNRVESRRLGSVGRPLPNQELRLAEDGEILVRGANVTPGYYGREDLTGQSFEGGWLKTGDVGAVDPDGYLYIKARKKEVIVTSSGINVYPEDVEAALARSPRVREGVAVEWEGEVHAVLLLEEGADAGEAIRDANRRLDSAQKIRGHTVWPHPDFPRSATMKVRRASVLEFLKGRKAANTRTPFRAGLEWPLVEVPSRFSGREPATAARGGEERTPKPIAGGSVASAHGVTDTQDQISHDAHAFVDDWVTSPALERLRREAGGVVVPALRRFLGLRIEGWEYPTRLHRPCLLVADAPGALGAAAILLSLSKERRYRTVSAIPVDSSLPKGQPLRRRGLRRLGYYLVVASLLAVPIARGPIPEDIVRRFGKLAEEGWSLIVYANGLEGAGRRGVSRFSDLGILASRLRLPVVAVKVERAESLHDPATGTRAPASTTVRFGPPMAFPGHDAPRQIAKRIEEALKSL